MGIDIPNVEVAKIIAEKKHRGLRGPFTIDVAERVASESVFPEVEDVLPFEQSAVSVYDATLTNGSFATVVPYGCEYMGGGEWKVSETPDGYAMFVDTRIPDTDMEKSIRHELAHAAEWHTTGKTHECEGNHSTWLRLLKAPERLATKKRP